MRSKKILKNSIANLIMQVLTIVIAFISRKLFLQYLGIEYLSVNGLFTNILSLLSLSELGFSSAIVYHLYKPLAQDDKHKITALMEFYKNVYRIVAIVVTVLGVILSFFLQYFVKGSTFDNDFLMLIYYMFLIQTVSSYFYSYRLTLIQANQEGYIFLKIDLFFKIILTIVNLINICITRNFIIYLGMGIFINITSNIIKSRKVIHLYPELQNGDKLSKEEKKSIYVDVKNLFIGQLSTKILTSTDNIVISKFIGMNTIGLYDNYVTIQNYVMNFVNASFASLPAALGSTAVNESKEYTRKILDKTTEVMFIVATFCSVSIFCLSSQFVKLLYGPQYQIATIVVLVLAINFLIQIIKIPLWYLLKGTGLFSADKYISLIGAISNVVLSIFFVLLWGLAGVILGTIVSQLIQFTLKTILLFRRFFQASAIHYVWINFRGIMIYCVQMALTYVCCKVIIECEWNGFIIFFLSVVVCGVVPNFITLVFYRKTEGYLYVKGLALKVISRMKG